MTTATKTDASLSSQQIFGRFQSKELRLDSSLRPAQ
jgi:hypothetical protein